MGIYKANPPKLALKMHRSKWTSEWTGERASGGAGSLLACLRVRSTRTTARASVDFDFSKPANPPVHPILVPPVPVSRIFNLRIFQFN